MYYGGQGYGYDSQCCNYGRSGLGYAFILVLFILLVIIGCTCCPG